MWLNSFGCKVIFFQIFVASHISWMINTKPYIALNITISLKDDLPGTFCLWFISNPCFKKLPDLQYFWPSNILTTSDCSISPQCFEYLICQLQGIPSTQATVCSSQSCPLADFQCQLCLSAFFARATISLFFFFNLSCIVIFSYLCPS